MDQRGTVEMGWRDPSQPEEQRAAGRACEAPPGEGRKLVVADTPSAWSPEPWAGAQQEGAAVATQRKKAAQRGHRPLASRRSPPFALGVGCGSHPLCAQGHAGKGYILRQEHRGHRGRGPRPPLSQPKPAKNLEGLASPSERDSAVSSQS